MLLIDGSQGEGGGQILRTALGLSLVTGTAFRIESERVTEVFTGFGEVGVRAEAVAERAVRDARGYLDAQVPVGPYLADQLLVPLALAGGGTFRTMPLSRHCTTNIAVIRQFLDVTVTVAPESASQHVVDVVA